MGHLLGKYAPGGHGLWSYFSVLLNMLRGHAAAYRVIHSLDGRARVGLVKNIQIFDPAKPKALLDRLGAWFLDYAFNEIVLRAIADGRLMLPVGLGLAPYGPAEAFRS